MTTRITIDYFTNARRLADKAPDSLAAILRAMAQQQARTQFLIFDVAPSITDGTDGIPSQSVMLDAVLPSTVSGPADTLAEATGTAGSISDVSNAHSVFASAISASLTLLGLPPIIDTSGGVIGDPNTLANIDLPPPDETSSTPYNGVDFKTGLAAMTVLKSNHKALINAVYSIFIAVGLPNVAGVVSQATYAQQVQLTGPFVEGDGLLPVPEFLSSATTGKYNNCINVTEAQSFVNSLINNLSSLAYIWNNTFVAEISQNVIPLPVIAAI